MCVFTGGPRRGVSLAGRPRFPSAYPVRDTEAMADDRAADHLALARELEQRDVDVAARLDSVTAVLKRVDDARARPARVRAGLEAIPA